MVEATELACRILEDIRAKANEFQSFGQNSFVRIAIEPLSIGASHWLNYYDDKISEFRFEFAAPLFKKTTPTAVYGNQCCDGVAALKLATCVHNITHQLSSTSYAPRESKPDYIEPRNGYVDYMGCISRLIQLGENEGHDHIKCTDWARIYICVSGGKQKEDEICALAGLAAVRDVFCGKFSNFTIS
ncbi:hypothetical protein IJ847_01320 [Candidatus Saccharibacteria bacterium]|nr:hypothetical protein [Candidatus Saccharibacteria bacterium]